MDKVPPGRMWAEAGSIRHGTSRVLAEEMGDYPPSRSVSASSERSSIVGDNLGLPSMDGFYVWTRSCIRYAVCEWQIILPMLCKKRDSSEDQTVLNSITCVGGRMIFEAASLATADFIMMSSKETMGKSDSHKDPQKEVLMAAVSSKA